MLASYRKLRLAAFMVVLSLALSFRAYAQSNASSASISGTVLDPTGAVVPDAAVEIHNPVSGFDRSMTRTPPGITVLPYGSA